VQTARFPVSLLCVNADMTAETVKLHRDLVADRYVIGLWSWELAEFPHWMRAAFEQVDEVWTISDFCRTGIAQDAPVPVRVFPVPVRDPYVGGRPPAPRAEGGPVTFLFAFDYNSIFARKHPLAAVDAFTTAFADRDDVRLVLKSINGDKHPGHRERLRMAVAADPRIELVERYLDHDEVGELFAAADCYVSLHRSEGFGLTVAEAMARGLPVIATDYGGSAEVLTADTGWPIGYQLVPVGPGNAPYPVDAHWAEPEVAQAAEAMRAVAADLPAARARGLRAREHVLTTRTMRTAADWVADRLADARQRWQLRYLAAPMAPGEGVLDPLPAAREALRWRPDAGAPSRIPLAPALRRAVLRAIDHYDVHQRSVQGTVLDSVETSLSRLESRLDEQDRRHASARALAERSHAEEIDQVRADLSEHRSEIDRLLALANTERTGRHERLGQLVEALAGRLSTVEQLAAGVATGRDELDAKLMTLLHDRDTRIDQLTTAAEDSTRWVRALTATAAAHHELLDSGPAEFATAVVATDVGALRLPADDTVMLPWLRHYACWEAEESALVDHLLGAGDTFVDIGAHVGYFTLRALRRVGRDGAVFAVEPWAPARDLLDHNVRANIPAALSTGLTVLPVAAWDTDAPLRLREAEVGNSGDHRVGDQGGTDTLAVDGIRLDGVPALAARQVSMVKCDAQGQDHRALTGLLDLLRRDQPHVLCEFWPAAISEAGGDPVEVVERFAGWGYDVLPVTPKVVADTLAGDPVGGRRPAARTVVRTARESETGFVTLWLRPQQADEQRRRRRTARAGE
jgi:FkbM family methyltransferase